jgi:hypothetical protein
MTDQQTSTFSLYEEVRALPVDSDDCWLYAGKMNAYGYGFITSGRKLRAMVHRAMYETIIAQLFARAHIVLASLKAHGQ